MGTRGEFEYMLNCVRKAEVLCTYLLLMLERKKLADQALKTACFPKNTTRTTQFDSPLFLSRHSNFYTDILSINTYNLQQCSYFFGFLVALKNVSGREENVDFSL